MLAFFVTVFVQPEHSEDYAAAMKTHSARSVTEDEGCLRWDGLRDPEDPNKFYFYEAYVSEDAYDRHRAAGHSQEFITMTRPWRAGSGGNIRMTPIAPPDDAWR